MSFDEIQSTISLLHTAFMVCVILAVVFCGLAVLFFFRFGILQIIQQKTGWAAKRELAAFNEQNSATSGPLGRDNSIALGERTPVGLQEPPSRGFGKTKSKRLGSKKLRGAPSGSGPPTEAPAGMGAGLTIQLSSGSTPQSLPPPAPSTTPGFVMVKEALIVHTDAEI